MTDPWKTLGIKQGSSSEEIKKAYHSLVKKYHPDRFQDPAAKELANEKLKEINEAYEAVTSGNANYQGYSENSGAYGYSGNNANNDYTASGSQQFQQVRMHVQMRRFDEAESMLDQMTDRPAEWHFLRGVCYSFRGWYAMARENIAQAVNMEPGNAEYRAALNQLDSSTQSYRQASTPFGGGAFGNSGCSLCDLCACMACSDCFCDSLSCC